MDLMIQSIDVDTTITENRGTCERLALKFNGDIDAILKDDQEREITSGSPIWHRTSETTSSITSNGDTKCDQNPGSLIE